MLSCAAFMFILGVGSLESKAAEDDSEILQQWIQTIFFFFFTCFSQIKRTWYLTSMARI